MLVPGPLTKRLTGNGEKLIYSPAVGCNWLCLVYFPLFFGGGGFIDGPGILRSCLILMLISFIFIPGKNPVVQEVVDPISVAACVPS